MYVFQLYQFCEAGATGVHYCTYYRSVLQTLGLDQLKPTWLHPWQAMNWLTACNLVLDQLKQFVAGDYSPDRFKFFPEEKDRDRVTAIAKINRCQVSKRKKVCWIDTQHHNTCDPRWLDRMCVGVCVCARLCVVGCMSYSA